MARISMVVAMAQNRVIGNRNRLPWRLPADLKHFRRLTLGKPVVMGRRTYESIGKPLDGRINIVITRDRDFVAAGCVVVHSIDEALEQTGEASETAVIGGAKLYEQILPRTERIYLTLIHHDFDGDTWFPPLDPREWRETERTDHRPDDRNPYPYSFLTLEKSA